MSVCSPINEYSYTFDLKTSLYIQKPNFFDCLTSIPHHDLSETWTSTEVLYFFGYKMGYFFTSQTSKSQFLFFSSKIHPKIFPFKTIQKNLDLSYKTDLDFWDCFGMEKTS